MLIIFYWSNLLQIHQLPQGIAMQRRTNSQVAVILEHLPNWASPVRWNAARLTLSAFTIRWFWKKLFAALKPSKWVVGAIKWGKIKFCISRHYTPFRTIIIWLDKILLIVVHSILVLVCSSIEKKKSILERESCLEFN